MRGSTSTNDRAAQMRLFRRLKNVEDALKMSSKKQRIADEITDYLMDISYCALGVVTLNHSRALDRYSRSMAAQRYRAPRSGADNPRANQYLAVDVAQPFGGS